jgi:hypothetical protein
MTASVHVKNLCKETEFLGETRFLFAPLQKEIAMQKQKANLHQQAMELVQQLSTAKLKVAIDYLMYLQDKEAWDATRELASHPEIVESLERAEADVKAGRLKSWRDVRRNV